MECRECDSFIHDFMRAGVASEEMRAKVSDHIAHCAGCETHFFNVRSLERALRALGETIDAEQSAARMETVLKAVFAQQKRARQRSRAVSSWVATGVAASLLLSIGVMSRRLLVAPQRAPIATAPVQIQPADVPVAQKPEPAAKLSRKVQGNRKSKAPVPAQHSKSEEFVTGFYVLPYAGNSGRVFSGEIVRVTLRGSALPAIGFPVALNGDQTAEQVTADLFVAENGLPVAIRFVR